MTLTMWWVIQEGIRDQIFSVLRGDKCHNLAVVELKSAGVVKGMLSVIGKSTCASLIELRLIYHRKGRQRGRDGSH